MEMGNGVFRVKGTSGDTKLGGIDMDKVFEQLYSARIQEPIRIRYSK